MTGPLIPDSSAAADRPPDDRLDSWKEIAAFMRRDVTTVQRWEKREGMPVHRHLHDKLGSVYAFKTDLDAWSRKRSPQAAEPATDPVPETAAPARSSWGWRRSVSAALASGAVLALVTVWYVETPESVPASPLSDARPTSLTDFDGIEQGAAISADGRLVAFLSDREGQMDVWLTQIGIGQFHNVTRGRVRDLTNPDVRTPGFSPDGNLVTFWVRRPSNTPGKSVTNVWAVPVIGGEPRPYLEDVAEFDWADGTLVYHTASDGDPTYVRESGKTARRIFSAPTGLHAHYQVWSPDRQYIYFVQGTVGDRSTVRRDIWRIRPTGGTPERITTHDSRISHPVFLDNRTLLYLAGDVDGGGPWIHSIDVEQRMPKRLMAGLDRYTSLAASADGRRLVATLANLKGTLWRVPGGARAVDMSAGYRVPLTTGNGSSPRLSGTSLLYVASKGESDTIWRLTGTTATEVWSAPAARVVGAPAVARDGRRIAFTVRQDGRTLLYAANIDGTDARVVTKSLELPLEFQGAPAWTPDGQAITIAAVSDGVPRLVSVPLDGGSARPLVREYSLDPVWSPDGTFVVYSGPDVGTTFAVRAVKPDGSPYPLPNLTLTRGARHMALIQGHSLVVLRGEIQHKNLWRIDLETGAEQQLTNLPADFVVRDFDVTPAGDEVILEQLQEQSDIVLLELPRRD